MDTGCELEIVLDSRRITEKNITEQTLDLYVFNSKFIADHVYNGNRANIDSFSSDVKLTSPEIDKIDVLLNIGTKRQEKLKKWKLQINAKLESIFKVYNDEFQRKVSGSRLTNVKPLVTSVPSGTLTVVKDSLTALYIEYEKKSKEGNTVERLDLLLERVKSLYSFNVDIEDIKSRLAVSLSTEAKGKVATRIIEFQQKIEERDQLQAIGDLKNWFKVGDRLLHFSKELQKSCPLCNTNLSENIDAIITEYSAYFSDALVSLLVLIDNTLDICRQFTEKEQLKKNEDLIQEAIETAVRRYNLTLTCEEAKDQEQFINTVTEFQTILTNKKAASEVVLTIKEESIAIIDQYNSRLKKFIDVATDEIEKEKKRLQNRNLQSIITEIKSTIKRVCTLELNEGVNTIFNSQKLNAAIAEAADKHIQALSSQISRLQNDKNEEVVKLNAESKYINTYLKHFGISHFSIDRDKSKVEDNAIVTYSRTGRKKTNLHHSLSEGEKTALAFAYFISKLRVEKLDGNTNAFENCLIVIDDPISSLDDNRLFQTANLLDAFFYHDKDHPENQPIQMFIFSHNLTFVKYVHNSLKPNESLKGKIEEYYLVNDKPHLRKLPSGLKNFTNTYILKLKEIIDFKEKRKEYEVVKNYLPNYIRIVLETFLSFKLAMVNDGNDRLPGLSYLIGGMLEEFKKIEDVQIGDLNKDGVIKRLNGLRRIADHESHGSIYRAEEFAFISESELTEFAKHTLQVLGYIDKLHFIKVKGHS
jgi:wobble nucleotide-excising tRNase